MWKKTDISVSSLGFLTFFISRFITVSFLLDCTDGFKIITQQECIPVGCVPPAQRPYLPGPGGGGGRGKIIDSKENFIERNSGKKNLKKKI